MFSTARQPNETPGDLNVPSEEREPDGIIGDTQQWIGRRYDYVLVDQNCLAKLPNLRSLEIRNGGTLTDKGRAHLNNLISTITH